MKKMLCALPMILLILLCLAYPVSAAEVKPTAVHDNEMTYDYGALLDALPDKVKALLPNGIDEATDEQAITQAFDSEYLASLCTALLKEGITAGLKLFATLLGLIIVCAILSRCAELFLNGKSQIFDYALLLISALEIYLSVYSLFELTRDYIGQINDYMTGISAALGSIFLLSANVSTAAVQSAWLGLLLTVTEKLSYGLLFPLLQMSFAMTLVSSLCPDINLRSVTSFIRQICSTLLVASMTLITIFMAFQSSIASAADSLGLRSVKFAASNAIPLIGGLVSESMKTLATSLSLVKSTAGFIGVTGLLLCTLLPLSMLFTCRYSLSLSGTAADLLQASSIKPLIEEAGKLVGFLIAIVLVFLIFYLFTLSLFIHTANALA